MGNKGAGKGGDSTIVLSRGREKSEGEGLEKATIFKGFEQRRGDHFLVADVSLSGEPIYPHPSSQDGSALVQRPRLQRRLLRFAL